MWWGSCRRPVFWIWLSCSQNKKNKIKGSSYGAVHVNEGTWDREKESRDCAPWSKPNDMSALRRVFWVNRARVKMALVTLFSTSASPTVVSFWTGQTIGPRKKKKKLCFSKSLNISFQHLCKWNDSMSPVSKILNFRLKRSLVWLSNIISLSLWL